MKHVSKMIICLALAFVLCIGGCSLAFAEEAASEESLNNIFDILSQMADEGSEDTGSEQVGMTEYTDGGMTYSVPAGMEESTQENFDVYLSTEDFAIGSAYIETGGMLDFSREEDVQFMIDALQSTIGEQEMYIDGTFNITVDGYPGVWYNLREENNGELLYYCTYVYVTSADSLYYLVYLDLENDKAIFEDVVNSVKIEGGTGETDFSAALTGSATPAETPAEDGTDVTAMTSDEEMVLVDDENLFVRISNFSTEDEYYALTADVTVENRTDLNLYVGLRDVYVNGYLCNTYFGDSYAPGDSATEELYLYQYDFEMNNIIDVKDLAFTLVAYDDDDWSADNLEEEEIILYPFGEDIPDQPAQEFDSNVIKLIDTEDYKLYITGMGTDEYSFMVHTYLENNTDQKLTFRISDSTAIDGFEVNPYFYVDLKAGKKANSDIYWFLEDLEEADLDPEAISELELDTRISITDDWETDPLFDDVLTVQVQ